MVGLPGHRLKSGLRQFLVGISEQSSAEAAAEVLHVDQRAVLARVRSAQIEQAVRRYEAGDSSRAVARELGVSKTALLALLRQHGVMVRERNSLSEDQVNEAVRLYRSGLLLREIGERFAVSRDCVRLALKQRGVQLRRGLGARGQ